MSPQLAAVLWPGSLQPEVAARAPEEGVLPTLPLPELAEESQNDEVQEGEGHIDAEVIDIHFRKYPLDCSKHGHDDQEPGVGLGEGPVEGNILPEVVPDEVEWRSEYPGSGPGGLQPLQVLVIVEGEGGEEPRLLVRGQHGGARHHAQVLVSWQLLHRPDHDYENN